MNPPLLQCEQRTEYGISEDGDVWYVTENRAEAYRVRENTLHAMAQDREEFVPMGIVTRQVFETTWEPV